MKNSAKIILGIDPGTLVMGYGIIAVDGNNLEMRDMHVLKLPSAKDNYQRLQLIHEKVQALIQTYQPHEFAIEAPFFGKNVQSMLKLGRAQGVAIAAAIHAGLPVTEYSPRKVKQAVTGNGNAGKEQVWKMLKQILSLSEDPLYLDAADAIAVAVCHHYQTRSVLATMPGTLKGWDEFVRKNPGRVKL